MERYNVETLKKFGATGKEAMYRLCRSIYGWQIRERTGYNEQTIFRSDGHSRESYNTCLEEIQSYITAGYGVVVNSFE